MARQKNDESTGVEWTDRRRFLSILGALGATGLAGCGGDGGDDDTPTAEPTETPTDAETTPVDTTTVGEEPATETPTETGTEATDAGDQPLGDDPAPLVSFDGPIQVGPGATTTITGTLTNPYLFDVRSVEVALTASDDLEVTAQTDTAFDVLATQESRPLEWELTVPDATGEFELTANVTYATNTDEADVSTAVAVSVSRTLQAENADEMTNSVVDANHPGHNGDGFLNFDADSGATAVYSDISGLVGDAGETTLTFRYALDGERTIALNVNGERRTEITFTSTGGWESWDTLSVTVELDPDDTITLETIGDEGPNLDQITFSDAAE